MPSQDELAAAAQVNIGSDGMIPAVQPTQEQSNARVEALGPVDQFLELLKNPEFKRLRELLVDKAKKTEHVSIITMPQNVGDILGREQLFGERRGLLRLDAELEDRLDDLNVVLSEQP